MLVKARWGADVMRVSGRNITLPDGADVSKLQAEYKDGGAPLPNSNPNPKPPDARLLCVLPFCDSSKLVACREVMCSDAAR